MHYSFLHNSLVVFVLFCMVWNFTHDYFLHRVQALKYLNLDQRQKQHWFLQPLCNQLLVVRMWAIFLFSFFSFFIVLIHVEVIGNRNTKNYKIGEMMATNTLPIGRNLCRPHSLFGGTYFQICGIHMNFPDNEEHVK